MTTCSCTHYVVDYSDPERYHAENIDREDDPACPIHASCLEKRACWSCGSTETPLPAGTDDAGNPATVCASCGERQEEE